MGILIRIYDNSGVVLKEIQTSEPMGVSLQSQIYEATVNALGAKQGIDESRIGHVSINIIIKPKPVQEPATPKPKRKK